MTASDTNLIMSTLLFKPIMNICIQRTVVMSNYSTVITTILLSDVTESPSPLFGMINRDDVYQSIKDSPGNAEEKLFICIYIRLKAG